MEALLEKIESVREKHKRVLSPSKKSLEIPAHAFPAHSQNYLPGFEPSASERKTSQGRFYEFLTAGIYGGKVSDVKYKLDNETYRGSVKPDVVDLEKEIMWESKGFAIHYSCNMMNRQILGNMGLQLNNPNFQFKYALYQHPIKGMNSTYRVSIEQLIKDLSQKTLFSIVLPLDIILHLSIPGKQNGSNAVRHYEGERDYPNCICLNKNFSRGIFLNPEETIEHIGLSQDDYSFERHVSPEMEINGNVLNPFPIIVVSRKNHFEWIQSFTRDKVAQVELSEHLKPFRKRAKRDAKINQGESFANLD